LLLGVVLVVLLAVQTGVLIWFARWCSETVTRLPDALSDFYDTAVDAGHGDPPLDLDDPLLGERKVLLFHDVNARTAKDVSARLMYLDGVDDTKPIDLYISTQGGWPDSAFTIIDTMRTIHAPVNTWAVGGCYSAGVLILAAATGRRYATENAILMVHANLEDSDDGDSFAPLDRERCERLFKATTALPDSWYPMTDDEAHYLTPQEALRFRVIDEIAPSAGSKTESR